MEEVAGTAEKLAKDKVTAPPPPFRKRATQSIYSRVYSEDGKEARNKRAEQRRMRATGIEKLGEEEYKKLLEEIDRMTQTPVDMNELINKRMKEIAERLEEEGKEKEVQEQQKTRPGTSTETRPTTRSSTTNRQTEKADPRQKPKDKRSDNIDDDDDVSKSRKPGKRAKRSKTAAVPLMEDDDDDVLEMIMEKADEIQEPEEKEDDLEMIMDDDDDDDFQEPPPRSRKTTSKMPTKKRRVEKSTEKTADTEEETLVLFQRMVGPDFEVRASEEFEDDPKDKCGNPVEAAGFRATMKMLAIGLKEAVRKGTNIKETYTDLIKSTIEVAKAMRYPGATMVELKDVLKSVKDLKCNAWRKYLKGETKMEPADVEEEEPEQDLVIQGPILGKESTDAAAEAIHKLPAMLITDTKKQLKNLFEHTMQAHQHAAEASKCLKELHENLPLDVFLRIADSAVRPLVVIHIPQAEQVVEKLKDTALRRTQKRTGSMEVMDVMISQNLPQRVAKWTAEEEYRPVKMIASIVYKYVREAMFHPKKTVTQAIVDEFALPKTTIHRQLFGKKYPGGGQTLEKLRSQDRKVEATGSGPRKIAVILEKLKTNKEKDAPTKKVAPTGSGKRKLPAKTTEAVTEAEPPSKKGKGPGKKSGKERTAEDIRGAATAESEKRKREAQKRKAQEEEDEFDEDPDKPTKAEIRASKPGSKRLFIH